MTTVAFFSTKEGVGKTTTALLLVSEIVRDARATVIDADPYHPIAA